MTAPLRGLQRGDPVRLTFRNDTDVISGMAVGVVELASENGWSLAVGVEANVGPWVGGVALLWNGERRAYLNLTGVLEFHTGAPALMTKHRRAQLTEAEFERRCRQGGRRIAPGIWEDRDGGIHFSVPELLAFVDLPDTPANRRAAEATVRESLEAHGAPEVIRVEPKQEPRH